jgi:glycosyltransferase involved in cell wall biosynthesis
MITCIIPVHNRSKLLKRAIESVIGQGIAGVELIIVDDASTENLRKVVREFDGIPDLTIRFFRLPKSGANAARAYGQDKATRPFVQFLDSDDVLLPGKWTTQLRHFDTNADLHVSVAGTFRENASGRYCIDPGFPVQKITPESFLLDRTMFKIGAPLWRRNSLTQIAEWPTGLRSSQDWETHLKALLCNLRFQYCTDSAFLILGAPANRIADTSVASRSVNKILAIYYALVGSKHRGYRVPLNIRIMMLILATHRLAVYVKHGGATRVREILSPYAQLVRECLS